MPDKALQKLLEDIRACSLCDLPHGPRPVVQAHKTARILVVGQAPGRKVHETGIAFNDPSGDRLRDWMGIDKDLFYDATKIALVPMGFCFPGTGKSGDIAPRPECAKQWRDRLMAQLKNIELTVIIGQYAIAWHLGPGQKKNLTETVRAGRDYGPGCIVLPHPSPRNNIWIKKNPWFQTDILPYLKSRVQELL